MHLVEQGRVKIKIPWPIKKVIHNLPFTNESSLSSLHVILCTLKQGFRLHSIDTLFIDLNFKTCLHALKYNGTEGIKPG